MRGLSKVERKEIKNRAKRVLDVIGYDDQYPYVDSVMLARRFGFTVAESDRLAAGEDGAITVSEDGGEKDIVVNNERSFEWKRFVIAHELAHYLLHYSGTGTMFKHRESAKGRNLEENDADYFAACLLMPEESFKKRYNILLREGFSYGEIVSILHDIFATPLKSVERRIDEVCL